MILVTGATGFIGHHLADRLQASGTPVRCLVRGTAKPRKVPGEAVSGDLVTGEGLQDALAGVDTVIHVAGVTKALRRQDYEAGNVTAAANLARAAAGKVSRFVQVSSLAAIGPSLDGAPVDEDAAPHPVSHYGKSKLAGEKAVLEQIPDAVIVRPPVVYGPRDTGVFTLLKAISQGLVLEISGGPRWFSAIYVADLVDGLLAAARSPQAPGRAYFLAYPQASSWSDLADAAARIMGKHPRVVRVPPAAAWAAGLCAEIWARASRRPGIVSREKVAEARCRYWTCDTRRAAEELAFTASTSLEAGLALTLPWYKDAGWLKY